jgi:CheY-like chemotaxis protein
MYDSNVNEHQTPPLSSPRSLRVLIYSDDRSVRDAVKSALGTRPHPDLPAFEYVDVATEPVVWQKLDSGEFDLVILDGEAVPAGGLGIARQMKDELYESPPVVLLTGRPQDAWLATWSRAEAVVSHPLDPMRLASVVIEVARGVVAPA